MPRGKKTVSRQALIGEGGVALIARRVNEMGFLYHDRRVDHGIDGEIELVAPDSTALNLVVMVQSKATTAPSYTFETPDSFQWTADVADLDYWLSGNAPVIVVLSRPSEDAAWWFHVQAEFADARRRAERSVVIDKHTQAFDKDSASAIMRLGVPRSSGIFIASPPKRELLTTNLLTIEDWPEDLYVAPTTVKDYAEAWAKLREIRGSVPGWIFNAGMILTFEDPRLSPLGSLCDGGMEAHDSDEWAYSDNADITFQFADLLRRTLVSDYGKDVQWHQSRDHLHFRATRNLKPRIVGRGGGRRGRTVFGPHYSKADPERVSYYHHAAVRPRFRRLGDDWVCELGVDYCFTHDGSKESSFADNLLAGIKRLDRHSAVASWTRMWAGYLQESDLLTTDNLLRFGSLITFEVNRGIDDKWWGPSASQRPDGANLCDPASPTAAESEDEPEQLLALLDEMTAPRPAAALRKTGQRPTRRRGRGSA